MPLDCHQHQLPGRLVKHIRVLEHHSALGHGAFAVRLQQPTANHVVVAINRSRVVAM
jgi:hypothetical protein